jgi:hypothetical protein
MIVSYHEQCELCDCGSYVNEGDYFYDLKDTPENNVKDIYDYARFVTSKSTAKKWFKDNGWKYYKGCVFCESCFDLMKSGYVIMDKFNYLYSENGWMDLPFPKCIMSKDLAEQVSKEEGQGKILVKRKALNTVIKFLKEEIEFDIIGYHKENPITPFVINIKNGNS